MRINMTNIYEVYQYSDLFTYIQIMASTKLLQSNESAAKKAIINFYPRKLQHNFSIVVGATTQY